jgi:hypothetical protein
MRVIARSQPLESRAFSIRTKKLLRPSDGYWPWLRQISMNSSFFVSKRRIHHPIRLSGRTTRRLGLTTQQHSPGSARDTSSGSKLVRTVPAQHLRRFIFLNPGGDGY